MPEEQSTAMAVKKESPVKKFQDALTLPSMQKRIAAVLPKHMTPERVIKIAVSAISRNPLLLQCDVESVMKGVIISSELGLELNGALGHAYLVPFKNKHTQRHEAQFIAGYKGLVELARRSGFVIGVEARAVFENDFFEYEYGLNPKLVHKPTTAEPGKLKWIYAINRYKNGYSEFVVLTLAEVNRHRERSKAKDNGPWQTEYEAMALKTAVRVLMKLAPQSPEIAQAIEVEERTDRGERGLGDLGFQSDLDALTDGTGAEEVKTRTEQLADVLGGNGKAEPLDMAAASKEMLEALKAQFGEDEDAICDYLRIASNQAATTVSAILKDPEVTTLVLKKIREEFGKKK